jgi:hypothetical protein
VSDQRDCQAETLVRATAAMRQIPTLAFRFRKALRGYGLREACMTSLRRVTRKISKSLGKPRTHLGLRPRSPSDKIPNLRPGELVEVKSEAEIVATLDKDGKLNGLSFLPGMRSLCGTRQHVLKRVERICLEWSGEPRRVKNTVLLEGVICDGCDRTCFYFWREAWLRRVDNGRRPTSA